MNLKHLTDEALLADTKMAAQREREALAVVLHHLREVDRRRLFSALKFESINEYAVKELKYTEDQAWSRVSAMKLLKEIPAIEPKINDGTLSLTNLSLARKAFSLEANTAREADRPVAPRSVEEKLAVLEKIENLTKSEAAKVLRQETGVVLKATESSRELSDGTFELKSIVQKETHEAIDRLKGLLAHSHPSMTTGRLIDLAVKLLADQKDPLKKAELAAASPVPERRKQTPPANPRYIPAAVRQTVWLRDRGCCTNCGSTRAVQHEHIIPVALGGQATIENVKLLCRSCNLRSAINTYGIEKMSRYVRAPHVAYLPDRIRTRPRRETRTLVGIVSYA